MVDKALNDGARFTGACRGTGATGRAVGAAVSLEGKMIDNEDGRQENMF